MKLLAALALSALPLLAVASAAPDRDVTVVDHGRTPEQNLAAFDDCMTGGGQALISYDPASQALVCEP